VVPVEAAGPGLGPSVNLYLLQLRIGFRRQLGDELNHVVPLDPQERPADCLVHLVLETVTCDLSGVARLIQDGRFGVKQNVALRLRIQGQGSRDTREQIVRSTRCGKPTAGRRAGPCTP
jgi:hypothetical protein